MEFRLPELGEGVYEAELTGWFVKPGDAVKRGQNLLEVMTDKATMEVPSPFAGTVTGLLAEPGKQVKVGEAVLTYSGDGEGEKGRKGEREKGRQAEAKTDGVVAVSPRSRVAASSMRVAAAPSVRYLARKLGVDLAQL